LWLTSWHYAQIQPLDDLWQTRTGDTLSCEAHIEAITGVQHASASTGEPFHPEAPTANSHQRSPSSTCKTPAADSAA
jgi:hypothetical protein